MRLGTGMKGNSRTITSTAKVSTRMKMGTSTTASGRTGRGMGKVSKALSQLGVMQFRNRDKYEGNFANDLFEGRGNSAATVGVYHGASGERYDGEWRAGRRHGKGEDWLTARNCVAQGRGEVRGELFRGRGGWEG